MKWKQTNKKYKESMKQKAGSMKKTNKIDRPLANLTKMKREKPQNSKIRNAKGRQQQRNRNPGNQQRLF
jgi:hypothetical protein